MFYDFEMTHSENVGELVAALAKAQGSISTAIKDKENPYFKSKYADLSSVWEACRGPLSSNGLAIIQTVEGPKENMTLITMLAHSSNQWIKSRIPLILSKLDIQGMGSAITYARRYALSAMVGVCADVDDDGEKAVAHSRKQEKIEAIGHQKANDLEEIIAENEEYRLQMMKFLKDKYKINELSQAPLSIYQSLLSSAIKNKQSRLTEVY